MAFARRSRPFTTIGALIDALAERRDAPALIALTPSGVDVWSYQRLHETVLRLASGLGARGIGEGDRVAVLADTQPLWVVAALAAMRVGAVVVPMDVQLDRKTLAGVLVDSELRLIFTTRIIAGHEPLVSAGIPVALLDAPSDAPDAWERFLAPHAEPLAEPAEEQDAALFYTSGTTGPPKGVPLSHRNLAYQLELLERVELVRDDERVLLPLPLHHVYPFSMAMLGSLGLGLPLLMPQALTGPQIARALREGEATLIIGVPRLYESLLGAIHAKFAARGKAAATLFRGSLSLAVMLRKRGLGIGHILFRPLHRQLGPRVRVAASGGAALAPELAWQLEALGWRLAVGYGLTETSPLLAVDTLKQQRIGSVGKPAPGTELRLDQTAAPIDGDAGEILARGPGVFGGYRHLPEATAEAFTDGWFRTGDLGRFDADGFLYVLGRRSTLIVSSGGENIQPELVEEAYAAHAYLREAGVLQQDGQLVAVLVPEPGALRKAGASDEAAAVRSAVGEVSRGLPSYQRIVDYVSSREPLERTRLGKVQRHRLRERFDALKAGRGPTERGPVPIESMLAEDQALLEHPAAHSVWRMLGERFAAYRLTPDTSLQLDLGLDSLGWLDLTLDISQRTGIELDEQAIGRIEAVRDLLREVVEAARRGPGRGLSLDHPEAMLTEKDRRWLEPQRGARATLARDLYWLNGALVRFWFDLQVEGWERLPHGPCLIVPNHLSVLDPFVLATALGPRWQTHVYWAGWTGIAFSNPLFSFASRLARTIPVDPERGPISSLALPAALLKRGECLVWFPEGGRSRDGGLAPFKKGVGLLLQHHPVPAVPVAIRGTFESMPIGRRWPRRGKILVSIGEPLDPGTVVAETDRPQQIAEALQERVARLLERGVPDSE